MRPSPALLLLPLLLLLSLTAQALPPGDNGCGDAVGSARLTLRVLEAGEGLVAAAPEYVGEAWCSSPSLQGLNVTLHALLDLDSGVLRANFSLWFEALEDRGELPAARTLMEISLEGGRGLLRYRSEGWDAGSSILEARLSVEPRGLVVEGNLSAATFNDTQRLEALLSQLLYAPVKLEKVEQLDGGVVYFEALVPAEALAEATMLQEPEALELLRSLRGSVRWAWEMEEMPRGLEAEASVYLSFDPGLAARMIALRLNALGFNATLSGAAQLSYTVKGSAEGVEVKAYFRGPVIEAPSLWEAVQLAAEAVNSIAWSVGYEPLLLGREVAETLTPERIEIVYPNDTRQWIPFPGAAEDSSTTTTHVVVVAVTSAPATPPPQAPGAPAAVTATVTATRTVTSTVTETVTSTSTVTRTVADPKTLGAAAATAAVAASAVTLLLSRRRG